MNKILKYIILILLQSVIVLNAKQLDIHKKVNQMTLDQKIGQMMLIGFDGTVVSDSIKVLIEDLHIGSFILFALGNFNFPDECSVLVNAIQKTALSSELGIPLFIAMDQEGGIAAPIHYMMGATSTPGNMALGASGRENDAYNAYSALGNDMRACGVNVNFAPAIDILKNAKNTDYTIRSFGSNMSVTQKLARGAVRGLQDNGVIAAAKHFPGLAYFNEDTHRFLPTVDLTDAELMAGNMAHFRGAIEGGTDMIMTVHGIFTGWDTHLPATLSPYILKTVLRKRLKYKGIIISDSMGMGAIGKHFSREEATVMAVEAGCDIVLQVSSKSVEIRERIRAVKNAVLSGRITMDQIDASVTRILSVKLKYGLFENPFSEPDKVYEKMAPEHLVKANKTAALNGVVVLRDNQNLLPLKQSYNSILIISPPSIITRAGKGEEFLPIGTTLGDVIKKEFSKIDELRIDTIPTENEILIAIHKAKNADLIITYLLLTEFSPKQRELNKKLLALNKPTIILGLGMPSDARFFPEASTIVFAHSPSTVSIEAGVNLILGKAIAGGSLPFPAGDEYPQGLKSIQISE